MDELTDYLVSRVPMGSLEVVSIPQAPQIKLWLLAAEYPQEQLSPQAVESLMDAPPYWSFCWASGQVLAAIFMNTPRLVTGRTVIDFGAGSGVVAIAAAKAGAYRVIACDTDPFARKACERNARLNLVEIELAESLDIALSMIQDEVKKPLVAPIVCVADVFYDRDNLPVLEYLLQNELEIIVADSRLKGQNLPGLELSLNKTSCTVPDLDESQDFNRVNIYLSQGIEF